MLNIDVFEMKINLLFDVSFFKNFGWLDFGILGRCKVELFEDEE